MKNLPMKHMKKGTLFTNNIGRKVQKAASGQVIDVQTIKIPPWERYALTITEAAVYYHIGETKLRRLVEENTNEDFAILNGNRVLIKRKQFEKFLDFATAI